MELYQLRYFSYAAKCENISQKMETGLGFNLPEPGQNIREQRGYFSYAAKCENISEASRRLMVAQSSVSKAITGLEAELPLLNNPAPAASPLFHYYSIFLLQW